MNSDESAKNIDPNLYYLSRASIQPSEEEFTILMTTGDNARQYVCTPKHAKRLMMLLESEIEKYEKKNGVMKTNLPKMKKPSTKRRPIGFS
jgi:hypothetical protein